MDGTMKTSSPEQTAYGSLALDALCRKLQDIGVCDILELGPARGRNIGFWSRFSPSIYIADLRSNLPLPAMTPESPDREDRPEPDWGQILQLPDDRRFNVILAWDLLNYLEITDVSSLIRYLARFCRPGAILLALMYDQKQMPAEITIYQILDEKMLSYENSSQEMRNCPRHQPRAIAEAMQKFHPSDSFRLKNGIIEYLFIYEGAA
jgi:hypothetical protein